MPALLAQADEHRIFDQGAIAMKSLASVTGSILSGVMCSGVLMLSSGTAAAEESDRVARSGIDLGAFNTSMRAQDDFYEYVNGNWLAQTEIPPGASSVSMIRDMNVQAARHVQAIVEELAGSAPYTNGTAEQLISDFFRSYMDSDHVEGLGVEPVSEPIDAILKTRTANELLALGARLGREGVGGPFELLVGVDLHDPGRNVAWLRQSMLTLPGPDYYLGEDEDYAALRDGLVRYASELFRLAGIPEPGSRAKAVLDIEAKLAAVQQPPEEIRDVAGYHPYAVSSLTDLSSQVDWDALLASLGVEREAKIIVTAPGYTAGVGELLADAPLEHWKSYWLFRLLDSRAELLPEAFVRADFDFHARLLRGIEAQQPRSARAIRLIAGELFGTRGVLEWPVSQLYVQRHLSPEAKAYLETMIENLRASYIREIDGLQWMSESTKAEARRKAENLFVRIGYPDAWPDYSKLRIAPDDLVGNARRAYAYAYDQQLAKLAVPASRSDWINRPHWMYALGDLSNAAEFPAAFLQPPLFVPGTDDAYNYGSVGFVIGHELAHSFDSQGRRTDSSGKLRDWWTAEDEREFERRADQLVEYYNAFEPIEGLHVNGEMTLPENIADLAGLKVAYGAYMASLNGEEAPVIDGFTGPQRFMITYARIVRTKMSEPALRQMLLSGWGAPWKQRANGPLRHFPEFYQAFDVREGDGMWLPPQERVTIW